MDDPYEVGTLTAPTRIAATQYTDAVHCPLQFVLHNTFDKLHRPPPLPSSSAHRYIGIVYHRVIEAARRGKVGTPPTRSALERRWQDELSRIESVVDNNGDGVWLPLQQYHPHLERARLRCIAIAEQQQVRIGRATGPGGTEAVITSADDRVSGQIDAIETQNGRIVLKDFKSGHLNESSGEVKSQYRDQMLLYAALYFRSQGSWPDALCLVSKSGKHTELDWSQEQATATFQSATSHLDSIRRTIGGGGTLREERISNLANPDKGWCSRCQYRPICPAYRGRLQREGLATPQNSAYSLVDTVGTVIRATRTPTGAHLELQCPDAKRVIQNLPLQTQCSGTSGTHPVPTAIDGLTSGDNVMVFNTQPRRSLREVLEAPLLIAGRTTCLFRIPSP